MEDTRCIGGLSDTKWGSQYHQQDRVYSMEQCALALPAQIPEGSYKYMEIKMIGQMDHTMDHTFESANRVYGSEGISPTIPTSCGGGHTPKVMECVAMRGRNPENPSDRRPGIELEQRLEVREDNCVGTITTVQKDNMVLEQSILRMVRTEEGKRLRKQYENHEIRHGYNEYREAEPRTDGCSNTITTVQKDNLVLVRQATKEGFIPCEMGGVCDLNYPDSKTRRGRVQGNGQICPTLTTENIPSVLEEWTWEIDGELYLIRIRKLTPRECWRLMGFTDEDFDKAQEVNSNTQLYKQAGNSIVVPVLEGIFRQLIEGSIT